MIIRHNPSVKDECPSIVLDGDPALKLEMISVNGQSCDFKVHDDGSLEIPIESSFYDKDRRIPIVIVECIHSLSVSLKVKICQNSEIPKFLNFQNPKVRQNPKPKTFLNLHEIWNFINSLDFNFFCFWWFSKIGFVPKRTVHWKDCIDRDRFIALSAKQRDFGKSHILWTDRMSSVHLQRQFVANGPNVRCCYRMEIWYLRASRKKMPIDIGPNGTIHGLNRVICLQSLLEIWSFWRIRLRRNRREKRWRSGFILKFSFVV